MKNKYLMVILFGIVIQISEFNECAGNVGVENTESGTMEPGRVIMIGFDKSSLGVVNSECSSNTDSWEDWKFDVEVPENEYYPKLQVTVKKYAKVISQPDGQEGGIVCNRGRMTIVAEIQLVTMNNNRKFYNGFWQKDTVIQSLDEYLMLEEPEAGLTYTNFNREETKPKEAGLRVIYSSIWLGHVSSTSLKVGIIMNDNVQKKEVCSVVTYELNDYKASGSVLSNSPIDCHDMVFSGEYMSLTESLETMLNKNQDEHVKI